MLDLPPELVIQIFGTCSIHDALHLAAANRQLHEVWLEHTNTIVDAILKRTVEEYDEAKKVALLETRYSENRDISPLQAWLPRLIRNADFASAACSKHADWVEGSPKAGYWCKLKDIYTSRYTAYYLIRRFVHSYHHRELLPELTNKIKNVPEIELRTLDAFAIFLGEFMDYGERERQGIVKHAGADPRFADEEECGDVNYPEWDFAIDEISRELDERNQALRQDPNVLDS